MATKVFPRGDPRLAIAYVCLDAPFQDDAPQRRAITEWATRTKTTIVSWRVSHGPTSDTTALLAAIDALPSVSAGWLVVSSLDRLHPEAVNMASMFESLVHLNGARLESADGKFAPAPGQVCPICQYPVHPSSRYPRALCGLCFLEAADENGRRLDFFNVDMTGGFRATYADTGEERAGHICYVRGVRCWADEARFGGIVIETRP